MGVAYTYRSARVLEFAELARVMERAATAFLTFHHCGYPAKQIVQSQLSHALPSSQALTGLTFCDTAITGSLPHDADPYPAFVQFLSYSEAHIARYGFCGVEIGFEEKADTDPYSKPDFLGVAIQQGKCYFTYKVSGSQASYDLRYRREFLKRLIKAADLPMRLYTGKEVFNLYANKGVDLIVADTLGYNGENPGAFRCELPGAACSYVLDRLHLAQHALAAPQLRSATWYATTVPGRFITDARPARELYEAVTAAGFPAESYDVKLVMMMESLTGIESLRKLCGPRDSYTLLLGQAAIAPDSFADLEAVVTAAGFRVQFTPRTPVDLPRISEALDLAFA